MNGIKFTVRTAMGKEDYRKFLRFSVFRKNRFFMPGLAIFALILSFLANYDPAGLSLVSIFICWLIFMAVAFLILHFKIERMIKRRISSDKLGTFDTYSTLTFMENSFTTENSVINSTAEILYEKLFSVLETKEYFFFYLNASQASIICKRDFDSPDHCTAFSEFLKQVLGDRYKRLG